MEVTSIFRAKHLGIRWIIGYNNITYITFIYQKPKWETKCRSYRDYIESPQWEYWIPSLYMTLSDIIWFVLEIFYLIHKISEQNKVHFQPERKSRKQEMTISNQQGLLNNLSCVYTSSFSQNKSNKCHHTRAEAKGSYSFTTLSSKTLKTNFPLSSYEDKPHYHKIKQQ